MTGLCLHPLVAMASYRIALLWLDRSLDGFALVERLPSKVMVFQAVQDESFKGKW